MTVQDELTRALSHPALLMALGGFSIFAVLATLVLVPVALSRLPADYFTRPPAAKRGHPVLFVLKNLLGVLVILLGVALMVLPGQGILTVLLGLGLVDFPGRRRLELAVISRPTVIKTVNALRRRLGKPPIELPHRG